MLKKPIKRFILSLLFWIIAVLFTVTMARLQRTTGPTYPLTGIAALDSETFNYRFLRSSELTKDRPDKWDMPVEVFVGESEVEGMFIWKRYKYNEYPHLIEMHRDGGFLRAELPHQPPAGKLEYQVILRKNNHQITIPPEEPVVTRFKGFVPTWALLPHILLMFLGLLFAARTALSAIFSEKTFTKAWITLLLFTVGGLIFGPIVQKFAFGAYWTGWPFGGDWTDNKTAVMVLSWLPAIIVAKRKSASIVRLLIIVAMLVTFIVYLIPHSIHGSELDYNAVDQDSLKIMRKEQIISP